MRRPETSFEQLSARYGEDVARYMRLLIQHADRQHDSTPANDITFDGLSERYGEPAAEAILREIEKVADRDAASVQDYNFSIEGAIEPDFGKKFRLTATRSLLLYELHTLCRLIRYFAVNDNVPATYLEQELAENFDIQALSQLESCRFPDAVEHLLDLSEGKR